MRKQTRTTRRRFLAAGGGAVVAAGTVKANEALAAAGIHGEGDERSTIVVYLGPGNQDSLRFSLPDGSEVSLVDPRPHGDAWEAGHEAIVIENFEDGEWRLSDIQRLYREIAPQNVESRDGSQIVVEDDVLILNDESEPASYGDEYSSKSLAEIKPGTQVTGMGYRDSTGDQIIVALLGSK